jgi:hypothetical protein
MDKRAPVLPNTGVSPRTDNESTLADWAQQLGCTAEELLSSMSEAGRLHFEQAPTEQYELDLGAPA